MTLYGHVTTRLRYRFENLEQARAHVRDVEGSALFFCRDQQICFLPDAPVCLSFSFSGGEVNRLLHGHVAATADGGGTWIEVHDTRPLRALTATEAVRRSVRMGCDAPVTAHSASHAATLRMLDLGVGGARFSGAAGFDPGTAWSCACSRRTGSPSTISPTRTWSGWKAGRWASASTGPTAWDAGRFPA